MNRNKRLKVIDLFSGVGGLSYGFSHNDDFEIVAANEILPNMARSYSLNHPNVNVYEDDVKNFSVSRVKNDLGIGRGDIDIIVGGPPCQAFSTIGKRSTTDPRAVLFLEYARILEEFNPKFFLFENVKGITTIQKGGILKEIVTLFESLGYRIQHEILNSADFGAPQIRERLIMVGSKLETDFQYPRPTHYNPELPQSLFKDDMKPFVTLGEALGDLPLIGLGEEGFEYASPPQNEFQELMRRGAPTEISDHNAPKNGQKLFRIMQSLPEGGTPADLPIELRPISGFKNSYSRLWWDKPSTTITRNLGTPSSARCIHPRVARALTTREGARLQGFPDSYHFLGSRSDKNLQVGNAVPTFLSNVLAHAISDNFKRDSLLKAKPRMKSNVEYLL